MAKIGLKNLRYSVLTEAADGTPAYAGAQTPAKAVSVSVSVENSDAKLYADDGVAESDTSFSGGTVSMEIDEADAEMLATLLGHEIGEDGEVTYSANDVAPYVGLGRIVTKLVNGVRKYEVKFLYKVKFAEPSQEETTKGESVEFGTTTIEGQVMALGNGNWSVSKQFDTEAEAISYLEGLMTAGA